MSVAKSQCAAGVWEDALDDEDKDALEVFLAEDSMAALHATFTKYAGLTVGLTTWKDHIRRRCGCKK